MNDIMIIEERNSRDNTFDHFQSLISLQRSFLINIILKIATFTVLHKQIDIVISFTEINELDNIRMRCFLAYRYLILCTLYYVFYCFLFVNTIGILNLLSTNYVPSALFIALITSYRLVLFEGPPSCMQGIPHRRNHCQASFFEPQLRISCRLF